MSFKKNAAWAAVSLLCCLAVQPASAKAMPEQIAALDGPKFTCMGAERAGTKSGVAAYTGKWLDSWPGMKSATGYDPGPYAAEKPLFSITAANMAQYADKLTAGQKALFAKYPKVYRMDIYPSHRDFRVPDWVCGVAKKNAAESEVVHEGLGATGTTGAHPFPFPRNGTEAILNVLMPYRIWNDASVNDIANVYANGTIAWGKQRFRTLSLLADPKVRGSLQDRIQAYFYNEVLLPPRDKGSIAVGTQPNDFSNATTQAWQYIPGTRRVRQAPDVCCDYPVPPAGMRTVDDDYIFNGPPKRYTWKLVGKKEVYMPWNNFKTNDTGVKYSQLIQPGTINPDYMRYELQRVWVIEANQREGFRHIYKKREIYVNEDTWLAVWGDNYDQQDQLWRVAMIAYRYAPNAQAYHRGASIYHDVLQGSYEAGYLVNEAGADWWKLNDPDLTPQMFSPKGAAMGGH